MVELPDLHRESTLEMPVVGAVSALVGGILMPFSLPWGTAALVPCGLWLSHSVWLAIQNRRLRYRWSRRFSRRVSMHQLRTMLEADPVRYLIHIRYYGGFDAVRLCPAAVVEDRVSGELMAVYPPSWQIQHVCEQLGVRSVEE